MFKIPSLLFVMAPPALTFWPPFIKSSETKLLFAWLPVKELSTIVAVPAHVSIAPPLPSLVLLLLKVEPSIYKLPPAFAIAPPLYALLFLKVEPVILAVPVL